MYRTILCAVGLGSRERAEHLLLTARSLLEPEGRLHVVHGVERFPSRDAQCPDGWAIAVIAEAEQKLLTLCEALSIEGEVKVRAGRASEAILAIASEVGADLIVLSAHRPDLLDHVLGSTVDYVVRHARCSVLIDRDAQHLA